MGQKYWKRRGRRRYGRRRSPGYDAGRFRLADVGRPASRATGTASWRRFPGRATEGICRERRFSWFPLLGGQARSAAEEGQSLLGDVAETLASPFVLGGAVLRGCGIRMSTFSARCVRLKRGVKLVQISLKLESSDGK